VEVIKTVKAYAKEKGQSLSDLVDNYFKLLTKERRQIKSEQLSPIVKRLRGINKIKGEIDYKKY